MQQRITNNNQPLRVMKIWWLAHCIITLHFQVESCHGRQQHLDNKCNKQPASEQIDKWKQQTTINHWVATTSIVGMHHQDPSSTTSIIINNNHYQQHTTYIINNKQQQPPQTLHCHFGWTWGINEQCVQTSVYMLFVTIWGRIHKIDRIVHMCNLSHFEAKYKQQSTAEGN
jgi:hypothetical protein